MDQNSTNGSGPDKRNWRERLGIGAKEMPKLSDEFREGSAVRLRRGNGAGTAPRGAQPVTEPAPMAPRAPKAESRPRPTCASRRRPPRQPRATPRMPDNAAQEALAEKLRAQRAAAEKLAEQRVQAARDRAEGKTAPPEPAARPLRRRAAHPRARACRKAPRPRSAAPGGRPKFSFAEEPPPRENPALADGSPLPRPRVGAPLTPPRPALGGDRGQPPFLRPSARAWAAGRSPPIARSIPIRLLAMGRRPAFSRPLRAQQLCTEAAAPYAGCPQRAAASAGPRILSPP